MSMEEVLQLRCELEQMAIIKEVFFAGMIALAIESILLLILIFKLNERD